MAAAGGVVADAFGASGAQEVRLLGSELDDEPYWWPVLCWAGVWLVSHHVLWGLWSLMNFRAVKLSPKRSSFLAGANQHLDRYRRRLCRSQVYCALAAAGGVYLLFNQAAWTARDLLYSYSPEHRLLFSMAAGHWLVACWEDILCWRFLSGGLKAKDVMRSDASTNQGQELGTFFLRAYLVHHAVAAAIYLVVLCLHTCVSVATFGLVFEVPVLLMNHREFAVYADVPPAWFRDRARVEGFWNMLLRIFHVCRFGPSCVYVYSLFAWSDDISSLSSNQAALYHGAGVLFTALNVLLVFIVMDAWRAQDIARCPESAAVTDVFRERASRPESEDERARIRQDVLPVAICTEQDLRDHDGNDDKGEIWLLIDGVVYDVTSFRGEHPGGEAVLRQHAGKDASEAFAKAKHSVSARRRMQQMVVGPLDEPPTKYRIFEHNEELTFVFREGFTNAAIFAAMPLALYFGPYLDESLLVHGDPIEALLVPGCAQVLVGSFCWGAKTLYSCQMTASFCLRPRTHFLALFFIAHAASLILAQRPLPSNVPAACPTGLEIGAWLLFLFQDLREFATGGGGGAAAAVAAAAWPSFGSMVAFCALMASWALRGAPLLVDLAPEHVFAAVLLAASTCCISSAASRAREMAPEAVKAELSCALVLAGPWSVALLAACLALSSGGRPEAVLQTLWGQSWLAFFYFGAVANFGTAYFMHILNAAFMASSSWAARLMAITLSAATCLCGGVSSYRWLLFVALFSQLGALTGRLRLYLEAAAGPGFRDVPVFRIGTQALADQLRTSMASVLWRSLSAPIASLVNALLPEELCVYACEIPIFDLGEHVDLGVAAYYANPRGEAEGANGAKAADVEQPKAKEGEGASEAAVPGFFVCNVGHIDTQHEAGLSDLQRTMNALRDVWSEFRDDDVTGFIANVVAVFPYIQGTTRAKEVNFSAWRNGRDAHDWYARSAGHRNIMKQHTGGQLKTFGNLLASLEPVGKVRLQDRCQRCSRLVEAEEQGKPPPTVCPACGGRTFGYPHF